MKFQPEEFPIRALFLQTGLPVDTRFDGFMERARDGGLQARYEFAYALHTLALLGRATRPDIIPDDACRDALRTALALFEELGSQKHANSCLMAAVSHIEGRGCEADAGQAEEWLRQARQSGCREYHAMQNVWTLIEMADPARAPYLARNFPQRYDH